MTKGGRGCFYCFDIIMLLFFNLHVSSSVCVRPSALQSYRCGGASRGSTSHAPTEGSTGKHWFQGHSCDSYLLLALQTSPAMRVLVSLITVCFSVQITDPFRTSVRVSARLVHCRLLFHLSGQATKSQPVKKNSAVPDQWGVEIGLHSMSLLGKSEG